METLTQKQTRLVLAFVGGLPLAEAGRRAGYTEGQVYQAIKSTAVIAAISMLEGLHQLKQGTAAIKKGEMLLGSVNTKPVGSVVPEKAPIEA